MQKLQDKIYVALQHEIQKKHSAEDKLSKVAALPACGVGSPVGARHVGHGEVSEPVDVAVPELIKPHAGVFWGVSPGTCRRRRISLSKGLASLSRCGRRQPCRWQPRAAEPGGASGRGGLGQKEPFQEHFGHEGAGMGGTGGLLAPSQALVFLWEDVGLEARPCCCQAAQRWGVSAGAPGAGQSQCPQTHPLVPKAGGTVA